MFDIVINGNTNPIDSRGIYKILLWRSVAAIKFENRIKNIIIKISIVSDIIRE